MTTVPFWVGRPKCFPFNSSSPAESQGCEQELQQAPLVRGRAGLALVWASRTQPPSFFTSLLPQHHSMHVLCFSHFELGTNWSVFCALAKIMYLGFLSDILNTLFLRSHTERIVLEEFLLCGRPAQLHSHTWAPAVAPGLSPILVSAPSCSPESAPTTTVAFVHLLIYFVFVQCASAFFVLSSLE